MLFAFAAMADGQKLDSLKTALLNAPNQLEAGRANYLIAHELRAKAPNEANPYITNAISDFKAINDVQRTGKAYYLAGFIDERLNNDKLAAKNYLYASKYLKEAEDNKNIVKSYIAIANIALIGSELTKAEKYLAQALSASRLQIGLNDLGAAYLLMGDLNRMKGDYKAALASYSEANILLRDNFEAELGISATLIALGRLSEVEQLLPRLENKAKGLDPYWLAAIKIEQLRFYEQKEELEMVLSKAATLEAQTKDYKYLYSILLFRKWTAFSKSSNIGQANNVAKTLVSFCIEHKLNNQLLNYLPVLADYATAINEHQLANQWHKHYQQLQKNIVVPRQAQEEAIKIDLALAEQEFEAELRQAAIEAQLRQDTFMYYLNVSILIILLVAGYKMYKRYKSYQQMLSIVLRAYKDEPNLTKATLKSTFTPIVGSMYREKEKARQVTDKLKKENKL